MTPFGELKEPARTTAPPGAGPPAGGDEPLPRAADLPLPTGFGPDGPGGAGSFAAGFARQRFHTGLGLLKPGRRVLLTVAAVVGVTAISGGLVSAVGQFSYGGDRTSAAPPAAKPGSPGSPGSPSSPAAKPSPPRSLTPPAQGTGDAFTLPPAARPSAPAPGLPPVGAPAAAVVPRPDGLPPIAAPAAPRPVTATKPAPAAKPPSGNTAARPVSFQGTFIVNYGSNRCLAAQGRSSAPGTRLVLADCDRGDASQGWSFASDGTIRDFAGTMCVDVSGSPRNGSTLHLANCSGSRHRTQSFTLKSSYDLVQVQPDLCVDAKDNGTAAGTPLQLWSCEGTTNQKWHRP